MHTASKQPASPGFAAQERFLAHFPAIIEIAARHQLDTAQWQQAAAAAQSFRLKVPFIGAFSSGKTSLINAVLGEPLFSVQVTPETAIAAQIGWAADFAAALVRPDGSRMALQRSDLQQNRLADCASHAHIEVQHPALARWPRLHLLDLPGWGSGVAEHERVIDAHAAHSLAYVLVVGAHEGALRESLVRALAELAALQMPVILVLSKTDLRPAADVQAVLHLLTQEIAQRSGTPALAQVCTSARKNQIEPLLAALDALEQRADERFAAGTIAPALAQLEALLQHLDLLAQQRFADAALLQAQQEQLQAELAQFAQRLQTETRQLRAQIAPVQDRLRQRLLDGLGAQFERYFGLAESGTDPGDALLLDARTLIAQTLRSEFDPAVARYLDALEQALPQQLPIVLPSASSAGSSALPAPSAAPVWLALGSALAKIFNKHPLGQIVSALLPVLEQFFGQQRQQQMQQLEQERARERLRTQVRAAIERSAAELVLHLGPQLDERIESAEQLVRERIEHERAERAKVLEQLQARLASGESAAAAARLSATADSDALLQHRSAWQALYAAAAASASANATA